MKEAKVLLVEDDESIIEIVQALLASSPHELIGVARRRSEALERYSEAFAALRDGRGLLFDVVVLDANLSPSSHDGEDAGAIFDYGRRLRLPIQTIGFSASDMRYDYGIPVDVDPGKDGIATIDQIIDELPEPTAA